MIELYNVSKIVPSGAEMLTILHALDLRIPDGQFVSVVGPSGSGKSTLLGLVAGLDAPTAGQIIIDGEDITIMNEDQLAELRGEKLGFVFQSFHLIPSLTALENILVPMEIRGLRDARERAPRSQRQPCRYGGCASGRHRDGGDAVRFVFQMARRELRSSWRRLLFFFLSIAIGVGCIVAVRSMIQNANAAIALEARALLTADVQLDTNRPWDKETLDKINRIAAPLATARTETIDSATMIRPADPQHNGAMMIELKGIEPPFPLYGEFKLQNGEPFDHALLADHGAIVAPALLERLSLQVGDDVLIGNTKFQIRGVLDKEPGGSSGFRLGPRVFIERPALETAGLTGFA